ncbi:MAG: IS66 family transposase [Oceanipulchritudo sp.]
MSGYLDIEARKAVFQRVLPYLGKVVPASVLQKTGEVGKACSYLLGHGDALVRICDYGQVRLDNNLIENAVRPTTPCTHLRLPASRLHCVSHDKSLARPTLSLR